MHRVQKSVLVPFAAQQMFDLVDDVARYPEFLPWCGGSAVLAWEYKTQVLETVVGPVFNRIAHTYVEAFVRRAEAVYSKLP